MSKFYKWFADKRPIYGEGEYVLDGGWQPRIEGELKPCVRGFHVCRETDLDLWRGTELAEVEIDPVKMIASEDKIVVRSWRLVRWLAWSRMDMVDCAEKDAAVAAESAAAVADSDFAIIRATACAAACAANAAARASSVACAADAAVAAAQVSSAALRTTDRTIRTAASERKRQKKWILSRIADNEKKGMRMQKSKTKKGNGE